MSLPRLCALLLACALSLLPPARADAAEVIESYDSDIVLDADGSLEVTERIRVRAEGEEIRRGIYRDFPTRYRDRHGNRVIVGFEVVEVLRDGRSEPWFTETRQNGVRLNTGNDDLLPVPGVYTYTLRYRTTRQVGFFEDHDELYWNAIGDGWAFAKDSGRVRVQLPQAVPTAQLKAEGYSGRQGARGDGFEASTPAPGVGEWRLTRPLQGDEGLTIVLSFPKGLVTPPGRDQQLRWLLRDNRAVLAGLAGLALLLAGCVLRWRQVGRDPAPGTIIARYEPPAGISPGGLRHILRMGHDARGFSADLLSLAVGGALRIERDKGLLKDHWQLRSTGQPPPPGTPSEQRALLDGLFAKAPLLELKSENASTLLAATLAHGKALDRRFQGSMFHNNGGSALLAVLAAILLSGAAVALAVHDGAGLLLTLVPVALMLAVAIAFAFLVRAPTPAGRRMLDHIEGLRRYLAVAERQDLQQLPGPGAAGDEPQLDAQRFEALLPYAVALDVEEAWTKKFTLAVGAAAAAAATSAIAWYHGSGSGLGDIGGFTSAIGNQFASQISSSATPPGSSSGAGGGGFSGGGGGGGGGGGR